MVRRRKRRNLKSARYLHNRHLREFSLKLLLRSMPFVLVSLGIFFVCRSGFCFVMESELFDIKSIDILVEGANKEIPSADLKLDSQIGNNVFGIDLRNLEEDIVYNYKELKNIKVRRILPDTLQVTCEIRMPYFQVDSAGYFYLVSDDAVVLPKVLANADPGLPLVTGINLSTKYLANKKHVVSKLILQAIKLLKDIETTELSEEYKVVKIDIYDSKNPVLFFRDGTRLEIGSFMFSERCGLLKEVLEDLQKKKKKARVIDLRFDDVVVIPRQ
ncbi:MAG: cell division protein FtsQ/DivIB [Candidatus Omnitrophota bacterium]